MHRFYADGLGEIGSLVTLSEEDARHASRVLRMQPGDAAELFLDGRRFSAEIAEMTAEGVTARLISELPSTEAKLRITLYQGLPKAEKMELIVQKAVELGAARVVPVAMSRCVVQLSAKDGAKKQERWQKIAREACKQSGRCQMMAVDAPIAFPALLTAAKSGFLTACAMEEREGEELLRVTCGAPDAAPGEGVETVLWFRPDTHELTGGEIWAEGLRVICCQCKNFRATGQITALRREPDVVK